MWKNTSTRYGLIARTLHWSMAPLLFGLILLGLWMTGLEYHNPWYHRAPAIHEGFGVIAFALFVVRLIRRRIDPPPPLGAMPEWERVAARWTHGLLYLLMGATPVTGYLITTAKGRPVEVFGWFSIPAPFAGKSGLEDLAGQIHLVFGITLGALALAHMAAALKHHFFHRDDVLRRMAGALPDKPNHLNA
ncbi:MAG: cytochrome b [Magnetococcales bacterium]|nr:cytochrome b [Magnetococcales bacterium]